MTNGLVHHITVEESTGMQWVKRQKMKLLEFANNVDPDDGWMDDLRFYVLFNSISVISGQWADDNDRLCEMKPRLRLKRSSPRAGLELTTASSVGQRLTH